jgi:hypothetical protein
MAPTAQTLLQIKLFNGKNYNIAKKLKVNLFVNLGNYILDHAENCDTMEEDSVDRLWLVVRSLKKPEGKYVSSTPA